MDDAKKIADEIGIVLKEETENSDTVAEGNIIKQDTKKGTLVKSGDVVTVHVSTGVAKTTVPTVVGMDEGTAKATLTNANLKTNITYTSDETQTTGKVLSQSIEQGKEIAKGSTIDLTVNKIVKKDYTVTLTYTIPTNINGATTATNTTTTDQNKAVKIEIKNITTGKTLYSSTTAKTGQQVTCNLTGNGQQTIRVMINDEAKVTDVFKIDDYDGGQKNLTNE